MTTKLQPMQPLGQNIGPIKLILGMRLFIEITSLEKDLILKITQHTSIRHATLKCTSSIVVAKIDTWAML